MKKEFDPRKVFGKIVKDGRSRLQIDRGDFAKEIGGIDVVSLNFIEHGCVRKGHPPIERRVYYRIVSLLVLTDKEKNEALRSLKLFCPQRWRRVKIHSNYSVIRRRQARYQGRKEQGRILGRRF